MKYELTAPCHFGLEAVLKKELTQLGFNIIKTEDGRVTFESDERGIAKANIFLRTAERVLIRVSEFKAVTFDELFENIKALPWEKYIPENGKFWVKKASSVNSKLFSSSDIQSIAKKAIVERLKKAYKTDFLPESGSEYPLRIFIHKDIVTVTLDTTGNSLHKRGYRPAVSKAPISETLAAALIMLTPWRAERILVDPFCGSGTIPIEAAMIAANIAPGLNRTFTAQKWSNITDRRLWHEVFAEAESLINTDISTDIQGYDLDPDMIKIAKENAARAGVEKLIHFQKRDVAELSHSGKYGFIITNPPYGERLEEKENLPALYQTFGERFKALDSWSAYFISSFEDAQECFGGKADKNRKIYNGMLKTYFYQYMGPKPPKKPKKGKNPIIS